MFNQIHTQHSFKSAEYLLKEVSRKGCGIIGKGWIFNPIRGGVDKFMEWRSSSSAPMKTRDGHPFSKIMLSQSKFPPYEGKRMRRICWRKRKVPHVQSWKELRRSFPFKSYNASKWGYFQIKPVGLKPFPVGGEEGMKEKASDSHSNLIEKARSPVVALQMGSIWISLWQSLICQPYLWRRIDKIGHLERRINPLPFLTPSIVPLKVMTPRKRAFLHH